MVSCSGACCCVFRRSGKENYSGISKVCYLRCLRTIDRTQDCEEAIGLGHDYLPLPAQTIRLSCVVTFGHWACQACQVGPKLFESTMSPLFVVSGYFWILCPCSLMPLISGEPENCQEFFHCRWLKPSFDCFGEEYKIPNQPELSTFHTWNENVLTWEVAFPPKKFSVLERGEMAIRQEQQAQWATRCHIQQWCWF